jgi:hypothetical protein
MADRQLGAMFMSNNKTYEVQRTNNFEVIFEGLSDNITLAVTSCPIPTTSNDPIELPYGNSKIKVAGAANFEDFSLVCKDFIKADTEKELQAWRAQVYNPQTDAIGWAEDYKRIGRLYQYAPDGTCDRVYYLQGCWPTSLECSEFNYDGADKKELTMNISVDKAYRITE